MGRSPCCSKEGLNRGAWTAAEDEILTEYIKVHGKGRWRNLPKKAGLKRCGKSCRLRWLNYLRPDIKRGNISHDEEELIIRMHNLLGNRWSLIARRLPGRTDNEIKNYWNTILGKKIHFSEHCSASAPTCHNSTQSQPKSNMEPQPGTEVRPKPHKTEPDCHNQVEGAPNITTTSMANPLDQPSLSKGLPSLFTPKDLDPTGLMLDVEMGDVFLLDLLNSDYPGLCDLDYGNGLSIPSSSGGAPLEDWTMNHNYLQPNVAPNHHGLGSNYLESGGDWLVE